MAETSRTQGGSTNQHEVTEDLKGDARDLKDTALKQGEAKVSQEKDHVGRTARSASSAMRTAADELRDDDQAPGWLASAFSSVASEVDGLASHLQDKSPRELSSEVRRFARSNPSAFLAASAAAGFAAARFLRAGAEYHDDYDVGQSGGSGRGTYQSQGTYDRSGGQTDSTGYGSSMSSGLGERDQTVAQARANVATNRPMGDA